MDGFSFPPTTEDYNTSLAQQTKPKWWHNLHLAHQIIITSSLTLVMLGMGCTMSFREIWAHLRRPFGPAIGAFCQFIALPAVTFGLAHALTMHPLHAIGMLVIGCSPAGGMSNMFTYWTEGDVPLSVCMTSLSFLVALGMMPLNLFLYGRSWTSGRAVIPYGRIMLALASVLIPVIVGNLVRWKFPKIAVGITKAGSLTGVLLIPIIMTMQFFLYRWFTVRQWNIWVGAFLLPLTGFLLGYLIASISRMRGHTCRTIAFETSSQNIPLAMGVVLLTFPTDMVGDIMMFPLIYGIFIIPGGTVVCGLYQIAKRYLGIRFDVYNSPQDQCPEQQKFTEMCTINQLERSAPEEQPLNKN